LAFDPSRNVTWMYGGLDDSITRYQSQLWQFNTLSNTVTEVPVDTTTTNPPPPQLASHAMEYVAQADAVLLWGGTCSDDSELHIYDPRRNSWCRIFHANRPDRRDAMLWSLQFPHFYIAQGDSICYNRQVLTLADVHVLDLQDVGSSSIGGWEMLYEPSNVPRGTGLEAYCDGSNAGNCQPRPLLWWEEDTASTSTSTCSPDLLARFVNATAGDNENSTMDPTTMDGSPTMDPTNFRTIIMEPTSSPTQIIDTVGNQTGAGEEKQSGAHRSSPPGLVLLAWMLIWVVKHMV